MGYTAEDEALIKEKWDDLLLACTRICKNDEDWNLIKRAFFLAKEAHEGVRRRSGEPYLLHPIAVARIVIDEIGLGVKSVVAALLHDVVEDTEYTVEDMERIFGPKIASMVDGLTKMSGVFNADTSEQAEYFRKVLLTLSDDVRVILIKIADRLHNMRTLGSMPLNKQIKITGETIYLFAPLAYRLGLYSIKSELEDLCMKYRFPQQYAEITQKLQESEASRREFIDKFNAPIIAALNRDNFNYEISGRVKSVYSIWSKMQRKQIPFEEIYDLFAIRIVFKPLPVPSEKTQCWQIYSTITDIYTPKPDRLRDWISMPKANGYEALHSTVMGPDGVWVEVQIRTQRMEDIAERGFAAHWKYKHATISQDEDEFDKWLKQIRAALNSPTENAVDFLDNFKLSLYTSEIVVFTPKGESRKMPYGATALDFAYDIIKKQFHIRRPRIDDLFGKRFYLELILFKTHISGFSLLYDLYRRGVDLFIYIVVHLHDKSGQTGFSRIIGSDLEGNGILGNNNVRDPAIRNVFFRLVSIDDPGRDPFQSQIHIGIERYMYWTLPIG